ncbi:MAG: C40 family peptidase [Gemmatimonadaceae bacterium]
MNERYAVRAAVAPMLGEPRVGSEQLSQRVAGHMVSVLEERGRWLRVRGEDEYEGWMHSGYLEPVTPELTARSEGRRVSLGCVVCEADGRRRALPLGAVVAGDAAVERGEALLPNEARTRFPRDGRAIARTASELFEGAPYLWGGVTPWGADCSGLVQTTFALHGVQMPRDAWQQARTGDAVGPDIGALHPGDLLFFSSRPDRHITHVAVSRGGHHIVHVAVDLGGYGTQRLDDPCDAGAQALLERFVLARRPRL